MRTSSVSESQTIPAVKEETCCTHLPFAIAIIIMIGSAFLLLAAYRIFPSYPNPISELSTGGLAIGYCAAGIGGIVLIIAVKNKCAAAPEKRLGLIRVMDGREISKYEHYAYVNEMRALERELDTLDSNICNESLSKFMPKFKAIYEKARAKIQDVDAESESDLHDLNEEALLLNAQIDIAQIKLALIIWRLHHQKSVPVELRDPQCQAYKALAACLKSLTQG